MKWAYLAFWAAVTAWDLPRLRRSGEKRAAWVWLTAAVVGLVLALWYFWGETTWRLAEWVIKK